MEAQIFCFTSTGNSLAVAKEIARRIDGSILPISSTRGLERINVQSPGVIAKITNLTVLKNVNTYTHAIRNFAITTEPYFERSSPIIGIVCPVYHATFNEIGVPFLVEDFIKKLTGLEDKYIFFICTHNGMPGFTVHNVDALITPTLLFLP